MMLKHNHFTKNLEIQTRLKRGREHTSAKTAQSSFVHRHRYQPPKHAC